MGLQEQTAVESRKSVGLRHTLQRSKGFSDTLDCDKLECNVQCCIIFHLKTRISHYGRDPHSKDTLFTNDNLMLNQMVKMEPELEVHGFLLPEHSVVLKRWLVEDAADLFEVVNHNRGHLSSWLPWVQGTLSVDDSLKFIEESAKAFDNELRFEYGIFLRPKNSPEERRVIGSIGIVKIHSTEAVEIGYWLAKEMEGQGIITLAFKKLMEETKKSLGRSRFVVKTLEGNLRSRKVAERLGFSNKGFGKDVMVLKGSTYRLIEYHSEL